MASFRGRYATRQKKKQTKKKNNGEAYSGITSKVTCDQRILVKSEVLQQISVDIVSNILSNIFGFQDLDQRSITS